MTTTRDAVASSATGTTHNIEGFTLGYRGYLLYSPFPPDHEDPVTEIVATVDSPQSLRARGRVPF